MNSFSWKILLCSENSPWALSRCFTAYRHGALRGWRPYDEHEPGAVCALRSWRSVLLSCVGIWQRTWQDVSKPRVTKYGKGAAEIRSRRQKCGRPVPNFSPNPLNHLLELGQLAPRIAVSEMICSAAPCLQWMLHKEILQTLILTTLCLSVSLMSVFVYFTILFYLAVCTVRTFKLWCPLPNATAFQDLLTSFQVYLGLKLRVMFFFFFSFLLCLYPVI